MVFVGLWCKVVVWTNKWFVSCLIIKCALSIRAQRILTYTHNSATKFEGLIFFLIQVLSYSVEYSTIISNYLPAYKLLN